MTDEELLKRLTEFNVDPRNTRLREYYETDNIWKTLKVERDENKHSAFLAWILGKDATDHHSFLHRFLNLLVLRSQKDSNNIQMEKNLRDSILMQKLKIQEIKEVTTEKFVSSLSTIRYDDRIDIYIDCEIEGDQEINSNYNRLEIIIENKVGASEGKTKEKAPDNPSPYENTYKGMVQTQRYYYACRKEPNLRQPPFDADKTLQLFVYLTPKEENPKDQHFIRISYQDLVDYVFEPYFKQLNTDKYTVSTLKEYLRVLGNPNNKYNMIMAQDEYQKELLKDFYMRNEDLFMSAVRAMKEDAETEIDEEELGTIITAIDQINQKKKASNRRFSVNNQGCYMMYEVVAEFVRHLLGLGKQMSEIETTICNYTKEKGKTYAHAGFEKDQVGRLKNNTIVNYESFFNSKPFYVTREWGLVEGSNRNFDGFLKGVKNHHPDFKITDITTYSK